jgi:hypothetical protein
MIRAGMCTCAFTKEGEERRRGDGGWACVRNVKNSGCMGGCTLRMYKRKVGPRGSVMAPSPSTVRGVRRGLNNHPCVGEERERERGREKGREREGGREVRIRT